MQHVLDQVLTKQLVVWSKSGNPYECTIYLVMQIQQMISHHLIQTIGIWITAVIIAVSTTGCADPGQYVDLKADVRVANPAYPSGSGPAILIDAAHNNFHTPSGRYEPLAMLLRNDGYVISENVSQLSDSVLSGADVFVISNAHFDANGNSFTVAEIDALQQYVIHGGSLLLIADHTPFPGAIINVANAFSILFFDAFADDGGKGIFSRENAGLVDDPLVQGIDQVRTFGGSAFRIDSMPHRPLLRLGEGWSIQTMTGEGLSDKKPANGLLQGAVMEFGQGRVAVFGEAAMFSAQRYGRQHTPMGFQAPGAEHNKDFILRLFKFLSQADS
jgi:hypothetical protein